MLQVLKRKCVAHNANRRRRARLGRNKKGVVGQKSSTTTAENLKARLQALGDKGRHPKVEGRGNQARCVATLR